MHNLLSEHSRIYDRAHPLLVSGYVNQHVGNHCLRMLSYGTAEACLNHRKFASLDLCRISYGAPVRVTSPALESVFHLQVLLHGRCLWRRAGKEYYLEPGDLLVINPDDAVDLTYSVDCEKFIIKIPTTVFERVCIDQRWTHAPHGVRFTENRYRLEELAGLFNLLSMVCLEAEANERFPRVEEHYQQIVASKLLTLIKTNVSREHLAPPMVAFECIDNYIERNLRLEIKTEDLAQQAKMSVRSLYALFERHAKSTPHQYIRERRLEHIHGNLTDPTSNIRNVTELAMDYGFLHLGRFSESYRLKYGESPSKTLRDSRLRFLP